MAETVTGGLGAATGPLSTPANLTSAGTSAAYASPYRPAAAGM